MAAVGAPVALGLAVGAPAAAAAAAAAPAPVLPGPPAAFTDAIVAAIQLGIDPSGYELSYPVYIASLQPSLIHEYSDPRGRRDPAPVAAPAAAAPAAAVGAPDPLGPEIGRMNTYIKANRPRNWSNNNISNLLREARRAIAMPYDPANPAPYRAAFNAFLDAQANQTAAGVRPGDVTAHVNIGP
jgi:hypothetical protein